MLGSRAIKMSTESLSERHWTREWNDSNTKTSEIRMSKMNKISNIIKLDMLEKERAKGSSPICHQVWNTVRGVNAWKQA